MLACELSDATLLSMRTFIYIFCMLFFISSVALADERISAEFGMRQTQYNQVRISGDDGTQLNMAKSLDQDPYLRLDYKHSFENRHGFRLLYAPLKAEGSRTYGRDINFNGQTFAGNTKTETLYKFNSYRATYFYQLVKEDKWLVNIGASAKVRDANIQLEQNGRKKSRRDLGFVPLFYVWTEYWMTKDSKLTLDFDGLAAPQGRAFDVALMAGHRFSPSVTVNLGYRVLDGGVDNDKVYNFSQFQYYFANVEVQF